MAALVLRTREGVVFPLAVERWVSEATPIELDLLAQVQGPALDVGCGPGRVAAALCRLGIPTLGVDVAPRAVALARQRGATVLHRSVFDRVPGAGRWQTVLLLDGNVGIGGDPLRLLQRCRALAAPEGTIVVELEGPGAGCHVHQARLEVPGRPDLDGSYPWFAWAVVGADAIEDLAAQAGLYAARPWEAEGRWFARLTGVEGIGDEDALSA